MVGCLLRHGRDETAPPVNEKDDRQYIAMTRYMLCEQIYVVGGTGEK